MPRVKVIPPGTPITFAQFRTGLTFAEVKRMLWTNSDDTAQWKYARRGTVLGHWRALKLTMWAEFCERNPELVAGEPGKPAELEPAPF